MARAARRYSVAGRGAGLLYFHCLLPGLGGDILVWKSVFCFADSAIHSGTECFSAARSCIVSQPARCRCDSVAGAGFVCGVECGIHVSVGGAPDSAAREDFLERDDSQPVPGGAPANRDALERLSFSSPRLDASNRRPRHCVKEKTKPAMTFPSNSAIRYQKQPAP